MCLNLSKGAKLDSCMVRLDLSLYNGSYTIWWCTQLHANHEPALQIKLSTFGSSCSNAQVQGVILKFCRFFNHLILFPCVHVLRGAVKSYSNELWSDLLKHILLCVQWCSCFFIRIKFKELGCWKNEQRWSAEKLLVIFLTRNSW